MRGTDNILFPDLHTGAWGNVAHCRTIEIPKSAPPPQVLVARPSFL